MSNSHNSVGRTRLLPSLLLLGGLECVVALLPRSPVLMGVGFILIVFYIAYLVLVTRDLVAEVDRLSPVDRVLCRWSGVLAVGIALGLIVLLGLTADGREPQETWVGSRSGLFTIKCALEVGFILSVTCWCTPRALRHVRPVFFWRIVTIPLLLIYGSYVLLLPISQFVGDCDREPSNRARALVRKPAVASAVGQSARCRGHDAHRVTVAIASSSTSRPTSSWV